MIQQTLLRILLSPFALLYGLGVLLRDLVYRMGLVRSVHFDLPVISVGNLSVGGTGKTPHIEYLIRLLKSDVRSNVMRHGQSRLPMEIPIVGCTGPSNFKGYFPLNGVLGPRLNCRLNPAEGRR
jgi:tetraacyldisaccharide-1-P 4'-kinase